MKRIKKSTINQIIGAMWLILGVYYGVAELDYARMMGCFIMGGINTILQTLNEMQEKED